MDYAKEKYSSELVEDTKSLLKLLVLYIPFPMYYALYDQQVCDNCFRFKYLFNDARTPLHLDGGLKQIFPDFMPVNLEKYGVTIICRYSKDMNFHKIWRV